MLDQSNYSLQAVFCAADKSKVYKGTKYMRRDDDLIRKLMLDFEASDEPLLVQALHMSMTPESRAEYYHLKCLADAGFLEENINGGVFRMTNAGHDFCAAIRDETVWSKTQAASAGVAGVGLSLLKDIGLGFLRAKLIEQGVPLA